MSRTFLNQVKNRRSVYAIDNKEIVSLDEVETIVKESITHVPSAFNSQSGRAILLKTEAHLKFWSNLKEVLKSIVPAEQFEATETRIDGFASGYGTVLFFEDQGVIQYLQENFQTYKDNFPIWSQQSNGMLQFVVWTAFAEAGLGASLQHYNELIANFVQEAFNVPAEWKLVAQMPFGNPTAAPSEKEFSDIEARFRTV